MSEHRARIARSGVQYYLEEELPGLMSGEVPREYRGQRVFAVYRPSFVLEGAKGMFDGVPVRNGHKWIYSDDDPAIMGRVAGGVEIRKFGDEVSLYARVSLDEGRLSGRKELSPGYLSDNRWKAGTAPDGTPYEILCTGIREVNHLALVDRARGGEAMRVLDGGRKVIHSGLIRGIKRRMMGVFDGNSFDSFEKTVDRISDSMDNGGEGVDRLVRTLTDMCGDLPDSEEKEKLLRYVADIPLLLEEERDVRGEALTCVKESYKALDSDATSEVPEKPMEESKEKPEEQAEERAEAKEEVKDSEPQAEACPEQDCPPAQEESPAELEQKGASEHVSVVAAIGDLSAKMDKLLELLASKVGDAQPPVSKEDVAEDGQCADGECGKEEEDKGVCDSLPPYTQSLGAVEKSYSLEDAFERIKGRRQ